MSGGVTPAENSKVIVANIGSMVHISIFDTRTYEESYINLSYTDVMVAEKNNSKLSALSVVNHTKSPVLILPIPRT